MPEEETQNQHEEEEIQYEDNQDDDDQEMGVPDADDRPPTEAELPKKKRERKEVAEVAREPGKSLFPISKVQKIIKADKDIPIVAKEATYLIALAAEEFIKHLCEAGHHIAYREKRSTVQHKDIATAIRKAEEFMFLEEILPWTMPGAQATKRLKVKTTAPLKGEATTLDQFIVDKKGDGSEEDDENDIIMNEDGTMYAAGNGDDDDDDES